MVPVEALERELQPPVKGRLGPKRAEEIALKLLVICSDPISTEALRLLARFFTPRDYDELVSERQVSSLCGYPTCSNQLRDAKGAIRSPNKLVVVSWHSCYCSKPCFQAGEFYREQLSSEALGTRKNVAHERYGNMHWEEDILLLPEVEEVAKEHNKTVAAAMADMIRNQHLHERLNDLEVNDIYEKYD